MTLSVAPKEVISHNVISTLRRVSDPRRRRLSTPAICLARFDTVVVDKRTQGQKGRVSLGAEFNVYQLKALGFRPGFGSPCHANSTQLLRKLDPDALARVFSQVNANSDDETAADSNQIAIDGKTLQGCKDDEGKAEHCTALS